MSGAKRELFFLGDIHGNWDIIQFLVETYELKNSDIIQVGDFGIGFRGKTRDLIALQRLSDVLEAKNCILYAIRGNHDDPKYFKSDTDISFGAIKFLPDYTLLPLDKGNVFCVGGATSIDREYRKMRDIGWWADEVFGQPLPHLIPNSIDTNIDIVVTHTAGTDCFPIGVNAFVMQFAANDQMLLADLTSERIRVDRLFELLKSKGHKINTHVYGHFHDSKVEYTAGITRRLLNIDEFFEYAAK